MVVLMLIWKILLYRWKIISENEGGEKKYNFSEWTVKQLRDFASKNHIKIPAKSKKNEIVKFIEKIASHPEFVDKTQEDEDLDKELEEELIAGEEEDPALLHKEKSFGKSTYHCLSRCFWKYAW